MPILVLEKEKCALKLFMNILELELLVYIWKIKFSLRDVDIWMERI
jgi:hypothetical protein